MKKEAAERCKEMEAAEKAAFEKAHGDCAETMEQYIFYGTFIAGIIGALIWIHFTLVIYTYWQEAAEKEGDGEAQEDD